MNSEVKIYVATKKHLDYVDTILHTISEAAKIRGTGIAKRNPEYVKERILSGKAIIALTSSEEFAGFCYIESWGHDKFVANSGLIVANKFRGQGLARKIKAKAFELSRTKYPKAKIFGLTTGLAVMKINSELGYKPVTFSELTDDEQFWKGCQSCVNYDILLRTKRKHCLCTGMLYDPDKERPNSKKPLPQTKLKVYDRWLKFKRFVFLKGNNKESKKKSLLRKITGIFN
ncbi:GNAT family N-acetyltransferase [Marinilabiliaceae bacterium ANBcel2]|nr:GNAT family N-acetyltransferase [Marinilabiliaceae bacterium ANBcel2]